MISTPSFAIVLLAASLVVGQLVRLPLPGQGGGLLLSDVAVAIVVVSTIIQWFRYPQKIGHWSLVIGIFPLWSLFTLVIRFADLGTNNFAIAFLYWLRLTVTLVLLPALLWLLQNKFQRVLAQGALFIGAAALVLAGFIQMIVSPNLAIPGWDPHQGRLVSTWLDPNLFGGFLIVILPWLTSHVIRKKKTENRIILSFLFSLFFFLSAVALLLTQSRSSLLALAGALLILTPAAAAQMRWLSPRRGLGLILSIVVSCFTLMLATVVFIPDRLTGLLTSDETATLRLDSFARAWQLVEQSPVLGVGYNAYQFAASEEGEGANFTVHSRAGADNSLLTLWVTTGLVGVVLFLLPWLLVSGTLLRQAVAGSGAALGAAGSLLALVIHSQFVNSFLYSHLLVTLIIIVALAMTKPQSPMSNE